MAQVKYLITLILYLVLYVQSLYIATLVNLDHAEEYRQICS